MNGQDDQSLLNQYLGDTTSSTTNEYFTKENNYPGVFQSWYQTQFADPANPYYGSGHLFSGEVSQYAARRANEANLIDAGMNMTQVALFRQWDSDLYEKAVGRNDDFSMQLATSPEYVQYAVETYAANENAYNSYVAMTHKFDDNMFTEDEEGDLRFVADYAQEMSSWSDADLANWYNSLDADGKASLDLDDIHNRSDFVSHMRTEFSQKEAEDAQAAADKYTGFGGVVKGLNNFWKSVGTGFINAAIGTVKGLLTLGAFAVGVIPGLDHTKMIEGLNTGFTDATNWVNDNFLGGVDTDHWTHTIGSGVGALSEFAAEMYLLGLPAAGKAAAAKATTVGGTVAAKATTVAGKATAKTVAKKAVSSVGKAVSTVGAKTGVTGVLSGAKSLATSAAAGLGMTAKTANATSKVSAVWSAGSKTTATWLSVKAAADSVEKSVLRGDGYFESLTRGAASYALNYWWWGKTSRAVNVNQATGNYGFLAKTFGNVDVGTTKVMSMEFMGKNLINKGKLAVDLGVDRMFRNMAEEVFAEEQVFNEDGTPKTDENGNYVTERNANIIESSAGNFFTKDNLQTMGMTIVNGMIFGAAQQATKNGISNASYSRIKPVAKEAMKSADEFMVKEFGDTWEAKKQGYLDKLNPETLKSMEDFEKTDYALTLANAEGGTFGHISSKATTFGLAKSEMGLRKRTYTSMMNEMNKDATDFASRATELTGTKINSTDVLPYMYLNGLPTSDPAMRFEEGMVFDADLANAMKLSNTELSGKNFDSIIKAMPADDAILVSKMSAEEVVKMFNYSKVIKGENANDIDYAATQKAMSDMIALKNTADVPNQLAAMGLTYKDLNNMQAQGLVMDDAIARLKSSQEESAQFIKDSSEATIQKRISAEKMSHAEVKMLKDENLITDKEYAKATAAFDKSALEINDYLVSNAQKQMDIKTSDTGTFTSLTKSAKLVESGKKVNITTLTSDIKDITNFVKNQINPVLQSDKFRNDEAAFLAHFKSEGGDAVRLKEILNVYRNSADILAEAKDLQKTADTNEAAKIRADREEATRVLEDQRAIEVEVKKQAALKEEASKNTVVANREKANADVTNKFLGKESDDTGVRVEEEVRSDDTEVAVKTISNSVQEELNAIKAKGNALRLEVEAKKAAEDVLYKTEGAEAVRSKIEAELRSDINQRQAESDDAFNYRMELDAKVIANQRMKDKGISFKAANAEDRIAIMKLEDEYFAAAKEELLLSNSPLLAETQEQYDARIKVQTDTKAQEVYNRNEAIKQAEEDVKVISELETKVEETTERLNANDVDEFKNLSSNKVKEVLETKTKNIKRGSTLAVSSMTKESIHDSDAYKRFTSNPDANLKSLQTYMKKNYVKDDIADMLIHSGANLSSFKADGVLDRNMLMKSMTSSEMIDYMAGDKDSMAKLITTKTSNPVSSVKKALNTSVVSKNTKEALDMLNQWSSSEDKIDTFKMSNDINKVVQEKTGKDVNWNSYEDRIRSEAITEWVDTNNSNRPDNYISYGSDVYKATAQVRDFVTKHSLTVPELSKVIDSVNEAKTPFVTLANMVNDIAKVNGIKLADIDAGIPHTRTLADVMTQDMYEGIIHDKILSLSHDVETKTDIRFSADGANSISTMKSYDDFFAADKLISDKAKVQSDLSRMSSTSLDKINKISNMEALESNEGVYTGLRSDINKYKNDYQKNIDVISDKLVENNNLLKTFQDNNDVLVKEFQDTQARMENMVDQYASRYKTVNFIKMSNNVNVTNNLFNDAIKSSSMKQLNKYSSDIQTKIDEIRVGNEDSVKQELSERFLTDYEGDKTKLIEDMYKQMDKAVSREVKNISQVSREDVVGKTRYVIDNVLAKLDKSLVRSDKQVAKGVNVSKAESDLTVMFQNFIDLEMTSQRLEENLNQLGKLNEVIVRREKAYDSLTSFKNMVDEDPGKWKNVTTIYDTVVRNVTDVRDQVKTFVSESKFDMDSKYDSKNEAVKDLAEQAFRYNGVYTMSPDFNPTTKHGREELTKAFDDGYELIALPSTDYNRVNVVGITSLLGLDKSGGFRLGLGDDIYFNETADYHDYIAQNKLFAIDTEIRYEDDKYSFTRMEVDRYESSAMGFKYNVDKFASNQTMDLISSDANIKENIEDLRGSLSTSQTRMVELTEKLAAIDNQISEDPVVQRLLDNGILEKVEVQELILKPSKAILNELSTGVDPKVQKLVWSEVTNRMNNNYLNKESKQSVLDFVFKKTGGNFMRSVRMEKSGDTKAIFMLEDGPSAMKVSIDKMSLSTFKKAQPDLDNNAAAKLYNKAELFEVKTSSGDLSKATPTIVSKSDKSYDAVARLYSQKVENHNGNETKVELESLINETVYHKIAESKNIKDVDTAAEVIKTSIFNNAKAYGIRIDEVLINDIVELAKINDNDNLASLSPISKILITEAGPKEMAKYSGEEYTVDQFINKLNILSRDLTGTPNALHTLTTSSPAEAEAFRNLVKAHSYPKAEENGGFHTDRTFVRNEIERLDDVEINIDRDIQSANWVKSDIESTKTYNFKLHNASINEIRTRIKIQESLVKPMYDVKDVDPVLEKKVNTLWNKITIEAHKQLPLTSQEDPRWQNENISKRKQYVYDKVKSENNQLIRDHEKQIRNLYDKMEKVDGEEYEKAYNEKKQLVSEKKKLRLQYSQKASAAIKEIVDMEKAVEVKISKWEKELDPLLAEMNKTLDANSKVINQKEIDANNKIINSMRQEIESEIKKYNEDSKPSTDELKIINDELAKLKNDKEAIPFKKQFVYNSGSQEMVDYQIWKFNDKGFFSTGKSTPIKDGNLFVDFDAVQFKENADVLGILDKSVSTSDDERIVDSLIREDLDSQADKETVVEFNKSTGVEDTNPEIGVARQYNDGKDVSELEAYVSGLEKIGLVDVSDYGTIRGVDDLHKDMSMEFFNNVNFTRKMARTDQSDSFTKQTNEAFDKTLADTLGFGKKAPIERYSSVTKDILEVSEMADGSLRNEINKNIDNIGKSDLEIAKKNLNEFKEEDQIGKETNLCS